MSCALILPAEEPCNRFNHVRTTMYSMAGNAGHIEFDNGVYLSEREHSARNWALAWFMQENQSFPAFTDLTKTMELYVQSCAITVNTHTLSAMAATLANGGICPLTQQRVMDSAVVRNCLSLMYTCGMYDYSGRFAFEIGVPCKSGVSGGLLIVIPGIMGIAVWSPRLDRHGNSVRGVEFCRQLVTRFPSLHMFERLKTPTPSAWTKEIIKNAFITAASKGDLERVAELVGEVNINEGDYDGRTAIHLAAAEGKVKVVEFLLAHKADPHARDRWGNTAVHEVAKHESLRPLLNGG